MGNVVGIDASTKIGMTCLSKEGELNEVKLIKFPEFSGFKRLHLITKSVISILETWKPELISIEGYAFSNRFTLVTLVEVGTLIRDYMYRSKLEWIEVPPKVLKKYVTGSGNATKQIMARSVKDRWSFTSESDDIIDSFGLAKLGSDYLLNGLSPEFKGVCFIK